MADWERLAELAVNRRVELGHVRRPAFATASKIGIRTLSDIETGRRTSYDKNTLTALEHGLRWMPGSVASVLDGGEPTPDPRPRHFYASVFDTAPATDSMAVFPPVAPGSDVDPAVDKVLRSDTLTDTQKEQIIHILNEERRRAEQQRVAHADELISLLRLQDE